MKLLNNARGMTLVELMISTGLFSIASLAMMALFDSHVRRISAVKNETELVDTGNTFFDTLENLLSAATSVYYCGCNNSCVLNRDAATNDVRLPDSQGCWNPTGPTSQCDTANATASNPRRLLLFEVEDANLPEMPTSTLGAECYDETVAAQAFTPYGVGGIPRGCKRYVRLSFVPPSTGTKAYLPGYLQLDHLNWSSMARDVFTGSTAPTPTGSKIIAQFSGVYNVWCGFNQENQLPASFPNFGVGELFTLIAAAKAPMMKGGSLAAGEPWGPDANAAKNARFLKGIHRTYVGQTSLRNIGIRGQMLGKVQTNLFCFPDGSTAPDGNCCSGYRNSSGVCLATTGCKKAGVASTSFSECCSHLSSGGVCL